MYLRAAPRTFRLHYRTHGGAQPSAKGPGDWFTGDVFIDTVAAPAAASRIGAAAVHFTPVARGFVLKPPVVNYDDLIAVLRKFQGD